MSSQNQDSGLTHVHAEDPQRLAAMPGLDWGRSAALPNPLTGQWTQPPRWRKTPQGTLPRNRRAPGDLSKRTQDARQEGRAAAARASSSCSEWPCCCRSRSILASCFCSAAAIDSCVCAAGPHAARVRRGPWHRAAWQQSGRSTLSAGARTR